MSENTNNGGLIWLLGDVHSGFDHIFRALDNASELPAGIVFLGDIEPQEAPLSEIIKPIRDAGVEVLWIRGNHDTDNEKPWRNLSDPESMSLNIDGRIVTIAGLRIAGLGGVFRGEVWHRDSDGGQPSHANYAAYEKFIRHNRKYKQGLPQKHGDANVLDASCVGKLLKHHSTIWPDTYEKLADQRADVLITHEAPSCHPHGFESIDLLAQVMGVKALFHGHQHDCLDYSRQFDTLGFHAYGVGFCGITDQDGTVIVPGDFDEARRFRQKHVPE